MSDPASTSVHALVLGAGRVGRAVARDLAAEPGWRVTVADVSETALADLAAHAPVVTLVADVGDPAVLARLAADFDLAVGALPSVYGFAALGAMIEARRPYVDISFFAEDPFRLDEAARAAGVTAVVDCGIAPGADNLILGHLAGRFEAIDRFECHVGGLPAARHWPWEYKAPFAPADVLEIYTRPARLVEHGRVVVKPALSEVEPLEFAGVGTLESFNTDGLRTLLTTQKVPFMKEKTLRYPGHAERMRALREAGFFSPDPVRLADGSEVSPLAVTSRLLFDAWRLTDDDDELTAFRVVVEGRNEGRREVHTYDLLDRRDPATGLSSMARSTGFTATAVARLVATGRFARPGVSACEHVGAAPGGYEAVLADLAARGLEFRIRIATLDEA